MENNNLPELKPVLLFSAFLAVIGWAGLAVLVVETVPTLGPRWLFFFMLTLAVTGTALPVIYAFNYRFPSQYPVEANVLMREALWAGALGSTLIWLQMGRMLTTGLSVVLALSVVLVEFLIRLGEVSRWRPKQNVGDE